MFLIRFTNVKKYDFLFLSKSTISLILTIGVTFAGQGFGGQAEQCSLVNLQRYGSSVVFSTEHEGNKLSQRVKSNSNRIKIVVNTNLLIGKVKECILILHRVMSNGCLIQFI